MGDPLVSVITPVLNRVETMGACIASIAGRRIDRSSTSLLMEDLQMERSTELITSATVGRVISAFGGGVGRHVDRSVPVLPVTDALVVAAVTGTCSS